MSSWVHFQSDVLTIDCLWLSRMDVQNYRQPFCLLRSSAHPSHHICLWSLGWRFFRMVHSLYRQTYRCCLSGSSDDMESQPIWCPQQTMVSKWILVFHIFWGRWCRLWWMHYRTRAWGWSWQHIGKSAVDKHRRSGLLQCNSCRQWTESGRSVYIRKNGVCLR